MEFGSWGFGGGGEGGGGGMGMGEGVGREEDARLWAIRTSANFEIEQKVFALFLFWKFFIFIFCPCAPHPQTKP